MTLLQKLRGRSVAELRERAGQEMAKRAERWGLRDNGEPSDAALCGWLGEKDVAAWRRRFASRTAPGFFRGFDAPDESAAAVRRADPEYAADVVRRADAALGGRFDVLGYRDLSFGQPIDWHLDPVAGVRAPRRHWSTIAYLDPSVAGDHKVVWELNRQQWLVDLGGAWWLTGDDRYARAMVAALCAWMDANPPKLGVNWASSLEVAFRAISWIWALEFLRRSPLLDEATCARLTKYLVIHARHIERYLSTYFSPNTHLTGEALGLYYIGTYLPELEQSARWRERGARVLLDQLPRHVRPDGVYFEQALHYHRYTIDFYTHLWLLDEANGGTLSVEIAPNLTALLEHAQCLTRGDGSAPLYGDEDGGRLFTLDTRPLDDLRAALATGAVLLDRTDFAYVAQRPTAQLVFLAGPQALDQFAALEQVAPRYASRGFEHGGIYVMRDGWDAAATHLMIDCGPHGTANCGHAHADALAFELALNGRPVLVDPGTYTYTVNPSDRDAYRSSFVHNAATVDGTGSSEPDGPFHWRRIAASRVLTWRTDSDGRGAYFEGSHNGFEHLKSPVRYRRSVRFQPDADPLFLIRDEFTSSAPHMATLTFQCAPDIEVKQSDLSGGELVLARDGAVVCRLDVAGEPDVQGRFEVDDAWVSPVYGARQRARRCRYVAALGAGTTALTTALHRVPASRLAKSADAQPALTEIR